MAIGIGLSLILVFTLKFVPIRETPLMMLQLGQHLANGESIAFSQSWIKYSNISPNLEKAVIAAEDMKFRQHSGFDWEAIDKALRHNHGSRHIRGGSTISQQVAKNVFLWPQRSWLRKGIEAYFTVLIEFMWSKDRIMEVYLNVIELGDGVYGVNAACEKFLGKPANKLSDSEAALIAAVLPNPHRFKINKPSDYVIYRKTMIQRRMRTVADPDDSDEENENTGLAESPFLKKIKRRLDKNL
jgi:monofunctional biosynthetic peptidoglycan transglycosylase